MDSLTCNHNNQADVIEALISHYENLPMQKTEIFLALKIENFQHKNFDIFLIFAQNIDYGYVWVSARRF